ncbi:MAG: sodium:alanine symporter family protein [Verrucomicrobiota bacterium]
MDRINEALMGVINSINDVLWGKVLVFALIGSGLYFTTVLGFIQARRLVHSVKVLNKGRHVDSGISPFKTFCTSLAARVGTGNIAGVVIAMTMGGPGAIFWMWLSAFLGMATSLVESTLAQVYKIRDSEGEFRGGPAYYMEKGIGSRKMGMLFSVLLILAFGFAFNAVQSNTIVDSMGGIFDVKAYVIGIVVVVLTAFVIMGGLKKIATTAGILVPIMAVSYLLIALLVVVLNISEVPSAFLLVFQDAFGVREAGAGVVGYTIAQAMRHGISRGLFSNEAGMGSAANIAGSATPVPNHPASQGYVQMLGVFVDTFVICTASAAMILLTGGLEHADGRTGISLMQFALSEELGAWIKYFLGLSILFFCFSSIIANYSYAETNFLFLNGNTPKGLFPFRLVVLVVVMTGALLDLPVVWGLADVTMGLMALTNITALIILSRKGISTIRDYNKQDKSGATPVFDGGSVPGLDPEIWPERDTSSESP